MSPSLPCRLAALTALLSPSVAQEPATQEPVVQEAVAADAVRSIDDLVRYIESRERSVASWVVEYRTVGEQPGGLTVRTESTVRVLGATHSHDATRMTFGDGIEAERETVRNEDGVFMREKDPVQGEVFTRMSPELAARLASANAFLTGEPEPDGAAGRSYGGAMLRDLAARFELRLREKPVVHDQAECWALSGTMPAEAAAELGPAAPDAVDVLVRKGDGVIVRMTHLRDGKAINTMEITRLERGVPLDPKSFVLEIPPRRQLIDAMDHPAQRAHIDDVLQQARAKGWVDPAGDENADKSAAGTGR